MARLASFSQIHNAFTSLGEQQNDIYVVNKDCLANLEQILKNLLTEDRQLRTYRRAISFGDNIRKDLLPLLINVRNSTATENAIKIMDATVKVLVNLTIPIECLLSLQHESLTDIGRHTIFELSHLLTTTKEAFSESRSTKSVIDYIKYVAKKDTNLNIEQCDSINNCLLLLINILHIPEHATLLSGSSPTQSNVQNQIVWNLFTQSIDKIMIYLMSCPQKACWGATMVQIIALMYKDQYVGTLQKLLSQWFEASLSESSEDNESNTSQQNQGSEESTPNMTSDPTTDSSDEDGGRKQKIENIEIRKACSDDVCNRAVEVIQAQSRSKALVTLKKGKSSESDSRKSSLGSQSTDQGICVKDDQSEQSFKSDHAKLGRKCSFAAVQSEYSDCGYVTQPENLGESISTSSNDDDQPQKKPVHQKLFQKICYTNTKNRSVTIMEKKDIRRKKLVKRSKTNM